MTSIDFVRTCLPTIHQSKKNNQSNDSAQFGDMHLSVTANTLIPVLAAFFISTTVTSTHNSTETG